MIRYLLPLALCACSTVHEADDDGAGGHGGHGGEGGSLPAVCPIPFAPTTEPPTGCVDVGPCDDVPAPTCAAMYRCDGACIAVYDCACVATLRECGSTEVPPDVCE